MIVPTMTNLEIYNQLETDLPKLKIRANTLKPKVVKQFRKTNLFPSWQCHEYTHQESKNKYLISFHVASARQINNPEVDYIGITSDNSGRIIIKWGTWLYRKEGSSSFIGTRAISYYCGHFFGRYRERIWPNEGISSNELICRYFTRNRSIVPIKLNEEIQRRYKEYGQFAQGMQVEDGICFTNQGCEGDETTIGERTCNFISAVWYYTIVSKSMLTNRQINAITLEGEEFVRTNIFEPFRKAFEKEMRQFSPQLMSPNIDQE